MSPDKTENSTDGMFSASQSICGVDNQANMMRDINANHVTISLQNNQSFALFMIFMIFSFSLMLYMIEGRLTGTGNGMS